MNKKKKNNTKKTTSHKRRIVLYLPTKEIVDKWNKLAEKSAMTTSSFIQEIVRNHIENEGTMESQKAKDKLINELQEHNRQLRVENTELSKKVTMLDNLTDRYEQEIKQLKNQSFLDNNFEGIREFNHRLIELLREKRNIKEHEIFDVMHIDPRDSETIKALNRQLDTLFEYNLVKKYKGGIQWLG